jgi:hypothetical protein
MRYVLNGGRSSIKLGGACFFCMRDRFWCGELDLGTIVVCGRLRVAADEGRPSFFFVSRVLWCVLF